METKIQKWGNSLALRIPKALADETGLKLNSKVNLTMKKGKLVIEPVKEENDYMLEELLSQVNDSNIHREYDFGSPSGKESW